MQVATDVCKLDNMDEKIDLDVCLEGSHIHEWHESGDIRRYACLSGRTLFYIRKDKVNVFLLILDSQALTKS